MKKDWNDVKDKYMYEICKSEFMQHEDLAEMLLETDGGELLEGNTWNDTNGEYAMEKVKTSLRTLMRMREELE